MQLPATLSGAAILGAALLVAAYARGARADTTPIAVQLDVPSGERPTHLCVITARGTLVEKKAAERSKAKKGSLAIASLPLELVFAKKPEAVTDRSARLSTLKVVREALQALEPSSDNPREDCAGKEYDACKPALEIDEARKSFDFVSEPGKDELFLTCGANSARQQGDKALVLFVSLNLIQSRDLAVTKIALDGTIGSIFLEGNVSPTEVGVMRVVGGHYLPGDSHPITGTRVGLPVEPRCSLHSIRIPRIAWLEAKQSTIEVTRAEPGGSPRPLLTCEPRPAVDHLDIRLPSTERAAEHHVIWKLGLSTELTSQWIGIRPPSDLALRFSKFRFDWAPDCTYPLTDDGGSCPKVEVAGVRCKAEVVKRSPDPQTSGELAPDPVCQYICETQGSFDLPAAVSFRAATSTDEWQGRVEVPDQRISDYVPPAQRHVDVVFPGWIGLSTGARSRILGVDLTFPTGEQRFLPTVRMTFAPNPEEPTQPIAVSRLLCSEPVKYRARGIGLVEDQEGRVEKGKLEIPPPTCDGDSNNCKVQVVRIGLEVAKALGERPATMPVPGPAPVHGYNLAGSWGLTMAEPGDVTFLQVGYRATLGAREYLLTDPAGENRVAPAFYGRLSYEVHAGLRSPGLADFTPELRIGIGLGGGYGHVLQGGRGSAIGGDFFLEPNVFVQAKALRLSGRWLFFEELNRVDDATGRLLGTTSASYLFLELGIEIDR